MKYRSEKLWLMGVFIIALSILAREAKADTVRYWTSDDRKTIKDENGDIVSETFDEIEIKSGGGSKKIKQNYIINIT